MPGGKTLVRYLTGNGNTQSPVSLLGLKFKNQVGLAAGLDKNGNYIDELSLFGFGFIEVGTVTPLPQPGNEKPRLFRLKKDGALINRMGFNNEGAEAVAARLRQKKSKIIVGGNIGKNKNTPNDMALHDYRKCLDMLYGCVDYFVINVSSPNTPGLRDLQEKEPLKKLLSAIKNHMTSKPVYYPVLLKVAPDLTDGQIDDIVEIIREVKIDGLIATNTTVERSSLKTPGIILQKIGNGGLSGKPLLAVSKQMVQKFRERLGADFSIIGAGGIFTPEDAREMIEAGANLVQIYTGLIYEGPALPGKIVRYLRHKS